MNDKAKYMIGYVLLLLSSMGGFTQTPDFELDRFYPIGYESTPASSVSANVKLYSDGQYLLLYVHVRDEDIAIKGEAELSDHVQIWFSLPQKAYPEDFEYKLHPSYVRAPARTHRSGKQEPPRYFSAISEYIPDDVLRLNDFVTRYDYPDQSEAWVPLPHVLETEEVHFGMVHFALFPDERRPVHINTEGLARVEESLDANLGNLVQGISYHVNIEEGRGYELHAQISREALGFATLPSMDEIRMMVDIWDAPAGRGEAQPILSTAPYRLPNKPHTFNSVYLDRPLYTNFTTIPDELFDNTGYHPICFYSDQDWIATGVDVDALVYREMKASQSLTEVRFTPQPFYYNIENYRGTAIQRLTVDTEYVNELPREKTLYWIEDQAFISEKVQQVGLSSSQGKDQVIDLRDGTIGLILHDRTTQDPFGWGEGGSSVEETITLYRVAWGNRKRLLTIQQGEGEHAYCTIGQLNFQGFFVQDIDWMPRDRFFIARLSHRYHDDKKRVKLYWEEDEKELRVTALD